jgi:hypothetical protein
MRWKRVSYNLHSSLVFVSTEDRRPRVKNVAGAAYVIMEDRRPRVENAVESAFVSTEDRRTDVQSVEAIVCVFTARSSIAALNANGLKGKLISSV